MKAGALVPLENSRRLYKSMERLGDLALANGTAERLVICGTSVELIGQMEVMLRTRFSGTVQNTWLGPTLGANTGPGVAISALVPLPPEEQLP